MLAKTFGQILDVISPVVLLKFLFFGVSLNVDIFMTKTF